MASGKDDQKKTWVPIVCLDRKKRGTYEEYDALSIAIIYGFRHFLGVDRILSIDVPGYNKKRKGKAEYRVMPDFEIRDPKRILAYGECKASWGDEDDVLRQLDSGLDKTNLAEVKRRFILMPVKKLFDLRPHLSDKFDMPISKRTYAGNRIDLYSFTKESISWDVFEYEMGFELAVCGSIVTEHDEVSNVESLLRLGQVLYEQVCESKFRRVRRAMTIELASADLLEGDRPEEERQLELLLKDAWAFLAEEYLRYLVDATEAIRGWIRTFQDLFNREFSMPAGKLEASKNEIPAMHPTFAMEEGAKGRLRLLGVQIPAAQSSSLTLSVVEASSGMGKSVSMIQETNSLAEAMLHSGGLLGIPYLPFHLDLKSLDNRDYSDLRETQLLESQDALALKGVGLDFLSRSFCNAVRGTLSNSKLNENIHKLPPIAREVNAIASVMCRFPIVLLVDGYDHAVSTEKTELLRNLLLNLKVQGVKVPHAILTSRIGFGAVKAFATSPGDKTVLMTIDQFRSQEQQLYFERWVTYVRSRRSLEPQVKTASWEDFCKWISDKTTINAKRDPIATPLSSLCFANSLLFNISIVIFLLELVNSSQTEAAPTESAFIDNLIENICKTNVSLSELVKDNLIRSTFDSMFFSLLCRRSRQVGTISGNRKVVIEQQRGVFGITSVSEVATKVLPPICDANFPVFRYQNDPGNGYLECIHPSFHEFFAGCFLADCLAKRKIPVSEAFNPEATPASSSQEFLLSIGTDLSTACGQFRKIIRFIGPIAFKHAVGRLVTNSIVSKQLEGVKILLGLLAEDKPLQQYLYDAAFLDEIILELELLADLDDLSDHHRILVRKMLGHVLYGQADDQKVKRGVKLLKEALMMLRETSNDRPLELFLEDHIWNRSVSYSKVEESRIKGLAIKSIKLAPAKGNYELLFRSGILAGHVGNQRLRAMEVAAANDIWQGITTDFKGAIAAYWRAIVFRMSCLPPDIDPTEASKVKSLISQYKPLPTWIAETSKLLSNERSLDVSQAIGDIAHQFSCIAQVFTWRHLFLRGSPRKKKSQLLRKNLEDAKSAKEKAKELWDIALERRSRDSAHGIKYYLWYPGTEIGLDVIEKNNVKWTEDAILQRLDDAVKLAGLRYHRAELGVLRNIQILQMRMSIAPQ
jgi:hypothetical protein